MRTTLRHVSLRQGLLSLALAATVGMAACDDGAYGRGRGRDANVDIRTPIGSLLVRDDVTAEGTGLPVYDGARPSRADEHQGSGNVRLRAPFLALDVAAATFETDDDPDAVLSFYRDRMGTFGRVTECRGEVDFQGHHQERTTCRDRGRSRDETQLAVGVGDEHRIVSVRPHHGGAKFSVVYVHAR